MGWLNEDGVLYLWAKIKSIFATKDDLQDVRNSMGELGYGDMMKSTYDTNNNGSVDNADKVNGHTVESDVPANAKFTDTVYEHPTTAGNKHIPTGGSSGQILKWSASGTAVWSDDKDTTYENATTSKAGLMSTSDKSKLDDLPTNTNLEATYAKKTDITGVYKYKGSVTSESALPTSGQVLGDVYDIQSASSYGAAGMNVAWNGTAWDSLGEIFTIEAIANTKIDEICV